MANKINTTRRWPYAPNGPGGESPSGLLPRTLLFRRTRMPVGQTSPSTRRDERLDRPADVLSRWRRQRPRRRPTALRLTLQPLPQRQRWQRPRCRLTVPVPGLVRRTDTPFLRSLQTLQLLPTMATSKSSDVPRLPISSGGPMQHPAFTWQQRWRPWCRSGNCSSQLTAAAALTTRSSTSPNKSHRLCAHFHSTHCRALTQLAEHVWRLHTLFLARLYNSCRTLQIAKFSLQAR